MKVEIGGADLILVGMFIYVAFTQNFFWVLGILPVVMGWFGYVELEDRKVRWRWK